MLPFQSGGIWVLNNTKAQQGKYQILQLGIQCQRLQQFYPFRFGTCNIHFSIRLVPLPVCSISWQIPHGYGLSRILGYPMQCRFHLWESPAIHNLGSLVLFGSQPGMDLVPFDSPLLQFFPLFRIRKFSGIFLTQIGSLDGWGIISVQIRPHLNLFFFISLITSCGAILFPGALFLFKLYICIYFCPIFPFHCSLFKIDH